MPKCEKCGRELFAVGWKRNEDNFVEIENYVCRYPTCPQYKDLLEVPVEVDEK